MSGLKSKIQKYPIHNRTSHPAWDEWIEIRNVKALERSVACLIPLGMSGLKYNEDDERVAYHVVSSRLG